MAERTNEIPHPYRSLLFILAVGGGIVAIVLGVLASTLRDDPGTAASVWVWAGHALTFGSVAFIGELVMAGLTWRAPRPDPGSDKTPAPDVGA